VVWLDHTALVRARVYPSRLTQLLDPQVSKPLPVYWGDVN
jgi:hypothetical protein